MKLLLLAGDPGTALVAPLAGAWIEIIKICIKIRPVPVVAPLAGAWIEIKIR